MKLISWLCFVVLAATLLFEKSHGQSCATTFPTNNNNGNPDEDTWIPFFPDLHDNNTMHFRLVAASQARLFLSPLPSTTTTSYYRISLGSDMSNQDTIIDHINAAGTTQQSYKTAGTSQLNGFAFINFWVSVTGNNQDIIKVGKEGMTEFATLVSSNPFDINFIAAGTFVSGTWVFCNVFQSLASGKPTSESTCNAADRCGDRAVDGNLNTDYATSPYCFLTAGIDTNPWWRVELGDEYLIAGVNVLKRTGYAAGDIRLQNHVIQVGSCKEMTDFSSNTKCGDPFTNTEATTSTITTIFRACPANTYGRYVYISDSDGSLVQFCEVMVYGVIASNPTELNFIAQDMDSFTRLESEGSFKIDVKRTSGDSNPTCTYFDINHQALCSSILTTATTTENSGDIWLDSGDTYTGLKLGPGETSKEVTLFVNDDDDVEEEEYLGLCLANVMGARTGSSSSIRIAVTDTTPSHYIPSDIVYTISESAETPILVTVKRSNYIDRKSQVEISSIPIDGVIQGNVDFLGLNAKVVDFKSGEDEATVAIDIVDDDVYEGNETFALQIVSATIGNYDSSPAVTVTIIDDEAEIGFAKLTYTQSESGPLASVKIVKTQGDRVEFQLTSTQSSSDTPATPGIDFEIVNRQLVFSAEQTVINIADILIEDDDLVEGPETFDLKLTTTDASITAGRDRATVTINDNDSEYCFENKVLVVSEGDGDVVLTVVKKGDLQDTSEMRVSTSDIDASSPGDYMAHTSMFSIPAEESTTQITIPIQDDEVWETIESFKAELTVNGDIACTTTVLINDDDALCNPVCNNGGACVAPNTCLCNEQYTGATCDEVLPVSQPCNPSCENGGSCIDGSCVCSAGFTGDRCESTLCLQPCQNGGVCSRDGICLCPPGFGGSQCQTIDNVVNEMTPPMVVGQISVTSIDGIPAIFSPVLNTEGSTEREALLETFLPPLKQVLGVLPDVEHVTIDDVLPGSINIQYTVVLSSGSRTNADDVGNAIIMLPQVTSGVVINYDPSVTFTRDVCPTDYCKNGGICRADVTEDVTGSRSVCTCGERYTGAQCETRESENGGLSGGAFGGIVIGVVAFILLVILVSLCFLLYMRRTRGKAQVENPNTTQALSTYSNQFNMAAYSYAYPRAADANVLMNAYANPYQPGAGADALMASAYANPYPGAGADALMAAYVTSYPGADDNALMMGTMVF